MSGLSDEEISSRVRRLYQGNGTPSVRRGLEQVFSTPSGSMNSVLNPVIRDLLFPPNLEGAAFNELWISGAYQAQFDNNSQDQLLSYLKEASSFKDEFVRYTSGPVSIMNPMTLLDSAAELGVWGDWRQQDYPSLLRRRIKDTVILLSTQLQQINVSG
jgi:hypothetical protein